MAQQKLLGQVLQSVSLKQFNDITVSSGIALGVITIDTIKEKFNVCVDNKSANAISSKIHEILLAVNETNTQAVQVVQNQNSSADEILKYKNLLDMGAITQEEYDKKKSELLGL